MNGKTGRFLNQYRFALIGFSRSGRKFGNYIYKRLTSRGIHIYPVNPSGGEVNGIKTYRNLNELPSKPTAVIIAVKASSVEAAVQETIKAGVKHVWIIGSGYTKEVEELCRDNGIEIIHNRCILMYFGGFPHNLHYLAHRLLRREKRINPLCGMYDLLGEWVEFKSSYDNSQQKFWLGLPDPIPSKNRTMAMYLHQQGSDWSGVLTSGMYDYCRERGIVAVSTDYRGPDSHLNESSLADISDIIQRVREKHGVGSWMATGVSMGAIASIQLTFLLPDELRPDGVVAVLPAWDISNLYHDGDEIIKKALEKSYKGTPDTNPEEYNRKSPKYNISGISEQVPFAIFSGDRDTILPPEKHAVPLVESIRKRGNPVLYREVDSGHDPEIFTDCFKEGLSFISEPDHAIAENKTH